MATYKGKEYDEVVDLDAYSKEYRKDGARVYWERDREKEKADKKANAEAEIDALLIGPDLKAYLKKIRGLD